MRLFNRSNSEIGGSMGPLASGSYVDLPFNEDLVRDLTRAYGDLIKVQVIRNEFKGSMSDLGISLSVVEDYTETFNEEILQESFDKVSSELDVRGNGFDVYNTDIYLGGTGSVTNLIGGDGFTDLNIENSAPAITTDEFLPGDLTGFYDFDNGILDFQSSNIPITGTVTLDFFYVFNQDVDDSVLTFSIDFTENSGSTFSKVLTVNFSDLGAQEDIEQISRITFFVGPTLNSGSGKIRVKCDEDATFTLKTLTIYTHI